MLYAAGHALESCIQVLPPCRHVHRLHVQVLQENKTCNRCSSGMFSECISHDG